MSSITGYNAATVSTLASGTYRHVALSISGTVHSLYLDGSMVAQNIAAGNIFASYTSVIPNVYIGCAGDLSYGLTGSIDDFKIWNRALPATDISAIFYSQYILPFSPTIIPGLNFWFDATSASSFNFSTQIWTDRSGNGYRLNNGGTYSNKIVLTTVPGTTKAGLNIPNFDNNFWKYQTSAAANYMFPSNFTLFYVFYKSSNPGPEANILWAKEGFSTYLLQFSGEDYRIVNPDLYPLTLVNNSLNILRLSIAANNSVTLSVNGTNVSTATYSPGGGTFWFIQGGGSKFGATPFNTSTLYISDIIHYTSVLTTVQFQKIEGYLAEKWGVQSLLPANHPYKSVPPTG